MPKSISFLLPDPVSCVSCPRFLVTFDLPVGTKAQRKVAHDSRVWLMDDGYTMIQWSVYARAPA